MARNPPRKADVERAARQLANGQRGRASKIAADAEVRDFIEAGAARWNLTELAEAALLRFGRPRAPSRSAIGRYCERPHPRKMLDAEVRAFIEQRIVGTMSYKAVAEAALKQFGRTRAPSKSTIARQWKALPRAEQVRIFAAATRGGQSDPR